MKVLVDTPEECMDILESIKGVVVLDEMKTNGDVIKALFPVDQITFCEDNRSVVIRVKESWAAKMQFDMSWWNAPYKRDTN